MDALRQQFPADELLAPRGRPRACPRSGAFVNGVFGKRLGKEARPPDGARRPSAARSSRASLTLPAAAARRSGGDAGEPLRWTAWQLVRASTGRGGADDPHRRRVQRRRADGDDDARRHRRRLPHPPLLDRVHEEGPGLSPVLRVPEPLLLLDARPDPGGQPRRSSSSGWEGVGLCSYLLIGFWFTEEKNASAGKKAFIANRIGDFGLLAGDGAARLLLRRARLGGHRRPALEPAHAA